MEENPDLHLHKLKECSELKYFESIILANEHRRKIDTITGNFQGEGKIRKKHFKRTPYKDRIMFPEYKISETKTLEGKNIHNYNSRVSMKVHNRRRRGRSTAQYREGIVNK